MLLLHQAGSVKIGEVVRYTVTYTPAHDRIIPSPATLHLKIKNTSAIPLRAAYIHGPYTLYAAAYPATFRPNEKCENPRREGAPEFEPNLKAGGTFTTQLSVPEDVRQTAGTSDRFRPGHDHADVKSVTWIIEVTSQIIFSNSAVVHYEILLGRDGHSLQMGFASSFAGGSGGTHPAPGQISDHQQSHGAKDGTHPAQPKGVYSMAITLQVDDTASLWNTPKLPQWDDPMIPPKNKTQLEAPDEQVVEPENGGHRQKRQKKIHLVILTHGLHSNLGADMLYLKESIDAAAKQARIDAKARKRRENGTSKDADVANAADEGVNPTPVTAQEEAEEDEWVEEEVIVRGFSGNVVKTEKGIKYLGKRLAKYVLSMTYPDQPYKPVSKKAAATIANALKSDQLKNASKSGVPTHEGSTILKAPVEDTKLAYTFTKISFIAHSLGGLIQMYAIAYIQKHSPTFFDIIEPINFIAMASPFLGLSNENPLYVKFALDFGLVGRTGQDLGLTWRAPTLARSGWGAIVGNIGESAHKKIDGESAPEAKPLLRILPTGPAHVVLKKFRNRTVYSNVVNDGIVPLRTSCLLFLDWSGLGRVEKARRENGLVGTMAGWGWAEITGANSSLPRKIYSAETSDAEEASVDTPTSEGHGGDVPQPPPYATQDDDSHSLKSAGETSPTFQTSGVKTSKTSPKDEGPFSNFMKLFQPGTSTKSHEHQPKHKKIYQRSQTLKIESGSDVSSTNVSTPQDSTKSRGKATALEDGEDSTQMSAPPKTTFFEAAGDLLKPPLPSEEFIMDPQNRPRTIFHDRVYHPEDIPPPPFKKRPTPPSVLKKRPSSSPRGMSSETSLPSIGIPHTDSNMSTRDYDDRKNQSDRDPLDVVDSSAMKVEEKIARAYHRDLSWRKVLVRLEPDAHNNMIVRRMFANAYGWPVVKHLCDTHFADSEEANTRDEDEGKQENAKETGEQVGVHGVETLERPPRLNHEGRTDSETREATDKVHALHQPVQGSLGMAIGLGSAGRSLSFDRPMSETWSDSHWADSADDSDECEMPGGQRLTEKKGWNWTEAIVGKGAGNTSPQGTDRAELDAFLGKKPSANETGGLLDFKAARMAIGLDQPNVVGESSGKAGK